MSTPIHVAFLANHSILWNPADADPAPGLSSAPSHAVPPATGEQPLSTEEQLKEAFVAFLEEKMCALAENSESDSDADRMEDGDDEDDEDDDDGEDDDAADSAEISKLISRKRALSVLVLALDPAAALQGLSLPKLHDAQRTGITTEVYFMTVCGSYAWLLDDILRPWETTRTRKPTGQSVGAGKPNKARPAADVAAQRVVPSWYGRCVLTGPCPAVVHAAHILPVRSKGTNLGKLWDALRALWPLPAVGDLAVEGREETQVLPLAPTVHALFDRFAFGLRPVAHPEDPSSRTKLYLQVVFFKDMERRGSLLQTPWSLDRDGGFADLARGTQGGVGQLVQHGDVYELCTTNPDAYPLPNVGFLEIQFAVRKLMAGLSGAGALRFLFGGDPPSDREGPTDGSNVGVPTDWAWLLEAAVERAVLDEQAAERWANALRRELVRGRRSRPKVADRNEEAAVQQAASS